MAYPTKIEQVVATRETPNGVRQVRAWERIVEVLAIGGYFEQGCAVAGVPKRTAYDWLRKGADLTARQAIDPDVVGTETEVIAQQFADAVARAEYEWEARALTTLEQLARGGIEQVVTTTKRERNDKGDIVDVETTTRTSRTLPDAKVIQWRLERRFPERYGHKVDVTSGGLPLQPPEERAKSLAEQAQLHLANAQAVETTATETKPKAPRKRKAKAPTKAPARRKA